MVISLQDNFSVTAYPSFSAMFSIRPLLSKLPEFVARQHQYTDAQHIAYAAFIPNQSLLPKRDIS